eukprot:scaffold4123_cov29-Attheya_sp.AAC.3
MSEDTDKWSTYAAHQWTRDSRTLFRQVIDETMAGSDPTEKLSSILNTTVAQDLMSLEEWSNEEGSATGRWHAVLSSLVDGLSETQRLRERRLFRDVAYRWTTHLDFYGAPILHHDTGGSLHGSQHGQATLAQNRGLWGWGLSGHQGDCYFSILETTQGHCAESIKSTASSVGSVCIGRHSSEFGQYFEGFRDWGWETGKSQ